MVKKLSAEDRKRIQAAIADAESKSDAHCAAVVLPASDRYALYPLVWGALAALVIGAALTFFKPSLLFRYGMLIEAAVFIIAAFALDWFPLRLLTVPARVKQDHAHAMAHREFAARILSNHRNNGILIFVSLAERYVEILASRDVHAKVGEAAWNEIVADFVSTAKAGRIADAVTSAIGACSAHLMKHFPKAG